MKSRAWRRCAALLIVSAAVRAGSAQPTAANTSIAFADARISLLGRTASGPDGSVTLGFPGSGFVLHTQGRSAILNVNAHSSTSALTVVVDDDAPVLRLLKEGENHLRLMDDAVAPGPHRVRVTKRTETWQGLVRLESVDLEGDDHLLERLPEPRRKLLFVGDSVTCGAGVARNNRCVADPLVPANDGYGSYGMILGRRLDAETDLVCFGGRGVIRDWRGLGAADGVLNAPEFVDLAIPADDPRLRSVWNPKDWQPDAVVVSLGTNDFNLQATKPLDEKRFIASYAALLRRLADEYPQAAIFATEGWIVTNPLLRQYIQAAVDELKSSRIVWLPARHHPGNGCDAHPTRDQHRQIADELEPVLRARLHW